MDVMSVSFTHRKRMNNNQLTVEHCLLSFDRVLTLLITAWIFASSKPYFLMCDWLKKLYSILQTQIRSTLRNNSQSMIIEKVVSYLAFPSAWANRLRWSYTIPLILTLPSSSFWITINWGFWRNVEINAMSMFNVQFQVAIKGRQCSLTYVVSFCSKYNLLLLVISGWRNRHANENEHTRGEYKVHVGWWLRWWWLRRWLNP